MKKHNLSFSLYYYSYTALATVSLLHIALTSKLILEVSSYSLETSSAKSFNLQLKSVLKTVTKPEQRVFKLCS